MKKQEKKFYSFYKSDRISASCLLYICNNCFIVSLGIDKL